MGFLETLESGNIKEIESVISERLAKNSAFFSGFYPHFYKLLTRQPEKYQLYLNDDDINIYNFQKKEFVYPKNTMIESSKSIAQNPLNNPAWKISNNNMRLSNMNESDFPTTGKIINTLIHHALKDEKLAQSTLHLPNRFLPTTTLFGLGSGIYLEYLMQNSDYIHSLMIFEEVVDFFRISTCFVDYKALFDKVTEGSCFLFIENIYDRKIVKYFFMRHKITSNFVRLSLHLYDTPKMKDALQMVELEQNSNARGWGTFEDEMVGVRNSLKNINVSKSELETPILHNPKKSSVPICVVGNGPSLDNLLPFIKANQENMLIFSAGTAIKPLKNYGITPDFQVEIERMPYLPKILKEVGVEDINLLCGNIVNPGVLELSENKFLFMRGSTCSGYSYFPKATVEFTYPFVGNAAIGLAMLISDKILLCGVDAGFKKGRTKHASGSFYQDEKTELPPDAIPVKGNFSDDIYADSIYAHSREIIELAIITLKPKEVLNLSDGAYIKGATPTRPETLTLHKFDKKAKIKEMKKAFSKNKKDIFKHPEYDSVLEEFEKFKKVFFAILKKDISSKSEFFQIVDEANNYAQDYRNKNPYLGILLNGSLSHIMNTIFLITMHIQKNDISSFYYTAISTFEKSFDEFIVKYKLSMMMARV